MNYISTRKNKERVSFKEAVINGLSNNKGLYIPEDIPQLPSSFYENIETFNDHEIAFEVLKPFVKDSLSDQQLRQIISETLSFPIPVVEVQENLFALELFHGPTQAFKDVGARFMSRVLSHFYSKKKENLIVLVATSGDTGSAVANGFYNVPGVTVKILFPKGKVTPYQEYQMTSLGGNIDAIEVDGTFDDCQKLVKEAFNDDELMSQVSISTANSINVARLLPQMLYYFFAYKQLKEQLRGKKMIVSVPSGNLGNITAGLMAQKMGLPIFHFVAALNANDTFLTYLNTGTYEGKLSVPTYANAMDVGNPSNIERIIHLFHDDLKPINETISAHSFSNEQLLQEIKQCYKDNDYLLDPHGAIGKLALSQHLNENTVGVFLGTAHPQKFSEVIQKAIPSYSVKSIESDICNKKVIKNSFDDLKQIILCTAKSH